jgi:ribonucleoside-triphosphate reductase (thioredoxin)
MSVQALRDYTFVSKYARHLPEKKRRETWEEAVQRVKEMHLRKYPQAKEEIDWAFDLYREQKALGSQRNLQYGGRPVELNNIRSYNCLSKDTRFITSSGVKSFADFADGDEVVVLSHTGNWRKAVVRCYGKDRLYPYVIKKGTNKKTVYATRNHRWLKEDGSVTDNLSVGDKLLQAPEVFSQFKWEEAEWEEKLYWCYGFVFGDGTRVKQKNGEYTHSMVRLCNDKTRFLPRFEEMSFSSSSPLSIKGDVMVYTGKYQKTLPDPKTDRVELIRAFVRGYLDADGNKNGNFPKTGGNEFDGIQATGRQAIQFIRDVFPVAGVYVCSEVSYTGRETNYGHRDETVSFGFRAVRSNSNTTHKVRIESIGNEEDSIFEEVWCLEVEEDHSFVLDSGIVTGNCWSTYCDRVRFFQEAFYILLSGGGIGFSVQKHHVAKLPPLCVKNSNSPRVLYRVPDSIEGWADSIGVLVESWVDSGSVWYGKEVDFSFELIRPKGAPISSGGKAPGPAPLAKAIRLCNAIFYSRSGDRLRPIDAYDIIMHESDAVLSGGVRRSASLSLFSPDDYEMATAKTGDWSYKNPQRGRSNNSALLVRNKTTREEFAQLMRWTREFGEPGFVWADSTEALFNPCVEIGMNGYLKSFQSIMSGWQACNLSSINGRLCRNRADFFQAAKAASIIGTLQAGYTDFPYLGPVSEDITRREALLGVSITGVMENPSLFMNPKIQQEAASLVMSTNTDLAARIGINPCARGTCVKPEGTSSAMLGTSSGIHPHHARRYFRRSEGIDNELPLIHLQTLNPEAVEKKNLDSTGHGRLAVFRMEATPSAILKQDVGAVELLEYVKMTQNNWVAGGKNEERCVEKWLSNNVSNTITVKSDEWEDVEEYIYDNREHFAGISLLSDYGELDFQQAPFVRVLTADELVKEYGEGSVLASGLVVDGLHAFNNNLWTACDAVMGVIQPATEAQSSWVVRAKKFADNFFNGDVKKTLYCLKEVSNFHRWCRLEKTWKDVDYTQMVEEEDGTNLIAEAACAGGSCQTL